MIKSNGTIMQLSSIRNILEELDDKIETVEEKID